jgi:hypothetical protein
MRRNYPPRRAVTPDIARRARARAALPSTSAWTSVATGRSKKEEGPATTTTNRVLGGLDAIIARLEHLYRDVHRHRELSVQEHRTAEKAAERLEAAGSGVRPRWTAPGVVGLHSSGDGGGGGAAAALSQVFAPDVMVVPAGAWERGVAAELGHQSEAASR